MKNAILLISLFSLFSCGISPEEQAKQQLADSLAQEYHASIQFEQKKQNVLREVRKIELAELREKEADSIAKEEKYEREKGVRFGGILCPVIEKQELSIRIQTPRKFSKAELNKGLKTFKYKNKAVIQFCLKGKTKRGEEYASTTTEGGEIYLYL